MAVRAAALELSYVEPWDRASFPRLPVRIPLPELAALLKQAGSSRGHDGSGRQAFPFHYELSGRLNYHETVVVDGDGDVIQGHIAVAATIWEAWAADNPRLFALQEEQIETWIEEARKAGEHDDNSRSEEQKALADHPTLAAQLERNSAAVFSRAELTDREVRIFELRFDRQNSLLEIGKAMGLSKEGVRQTIDKAIDKILALDAQTEAS